MQVTAWEHYHLQVSLPSLSQVICTAIYIKVHELYNSRIFLDSLCTYTSDSCAILSISF